MVVAVVVVGVAIGVSFVVVTFYRHFRLGARIENGGCRGVTTDS